jgi:hypothetical protein
MVYDGMLYFFVARNDPAAYYAYRGDLTVVSEYLNSFSRLYNVAVGGEDDRPYLVLDKFSLQTVHFLTGSRATSHDHVVGDQEHPDENLHRWRQVDPERSWEVRLAPGEEIIFTQSTLPDAERYAERHGDRIELIKSERNRFGQEIMRVYGVRVPEGDEIPGKADFILDA